MKDLNSSYSANNHFGNINLTPAKKNQMYLLSVEGCKENTKVCLKKMTSSRLLESKPVY